MEQLNYGTDWEYASSRLRDTVVQDLEGNPLYIFNVHENLRVYCEDKLTGTGKEVDLSDLNLAPVPLGYCNAGRVSAYTERSPIRYYKQGLTQNSLRYSCKERARVSVSYPSLHKTIKGIYPPLVKCAERVLTEESFSMAFSRNFALRKNGNKLPLYFREIHVGDSSWNMEAEKLNYGLHSQYKYLGELLEEEIEHV